MSTRVSKTAIKIPMTRFVFQDGLTYYFDVIPDPSGYEGLSFLNIYKEVEEKVITQKWFFSEKVTTFVKTYEKINEGKGEYIWVKFNDFDSIKEKIESMLNVNTIDMSDWDGFIGEVPKDVKKMLLRDSKLEELLKNK